jgi:hypothetical protein
MPIVLTIERTLLLAALFAVAGFPAFAQTDSHACYPNDAIVDGKRMQPTQAEIQARLDTPACKAALGNAENVDDSQAVQKELSDIDRAIEQQRKALSATAPTN